MKKVLVVVYTPTYGGPHNQIARLYKPLIEKGWETIALLPDADENSYKKLTDQGIKVITKPLKRLRAKQVIKNNADYVLSFRENIRHIKEVIIEEEIDVVQVCGLMHVHAAFACKELKVPLVWQFLGTFAPLPLRILYTPFATFYADWIMTTGMRTAKQHVFRKLFAKKHSIFYPPVDTQKFISTSPKRKKARDWMEVSDDAFLVGTVGNQNKTKGHDKFVDISEQLSEYKDICFRIIGKHTPSHAEYYKQKVVKRAYKKHLLQTGQLSIMEDELPVDTIMSGFDVFLLTSKIEGLPTVVLEAMSMGLPIVTNDVGSISEVISNSEHGYIYSTTDEACEYILKFKSDSSYRQKVAKFNRVDAISNYDVSVCAQKHADVYNKIT